MSLLLSVYGLFLPPTPPKPVDGPRTVGQVLGFDAFSLLRDRSFLVLFISSVLISIPLAFYYNFTNLFNRMQLVSADSSQYLEDLEEAECPDVIYLDPMFPERKKSAAVKKEMQLFHRLIGPDSDASRLFDSAIAKARNRVVVKRPRIAPAITGRAPSHTLEGKRNRYDVYLT